MKYLLIFLFMMISIYLTVQDANKHYREELKRSGLFTSTNSEPRAVDAQDTQH